MGKHVKLLAAAATAIMLLGCGDRSQDSGPTAETTPLLTAATLGEQTVLTVSEYLSEAPFLGADRSNGANQARICGACHSLDKDGPNMIGPALYGFFGTEAGSREGFDYSPAITNADFVWTPRALDAWLAHPGRFLPGNRMTFAGVLRQSDREDLIAYLLEKTTAEAGK